MSLAMTIAATVSLTHGTLSLSDTTLHDFESDTVASFPAGWLDIQDRVVANPLPSPTMEIIQTVGPDGQQTLAAQSIPAVGTSGMYIPIDDAPSHRLEIDLRVDSPTQANSWAMAVGFVQDVGKGDVNFNTQAILYTWQDRRMYLFVTQGVPSTPFVNLPLPNFSYDVGVWYRVVIEADGRNGEISGTVLDPSTGEVLSTRTYNSPQWDIERGRFDAYAVFDGEGNNASFGMQATLDNVSYHPVFNCPVDFTADGLLNFFDISAFIAAYSSQDPRADFTGDGNFTFFDVSLFLGLFNTGCP